MNIDIRTIVIVIALTHLMQVLVLYHQYKTNKNTNGTGWWLLWSAAEVLGFSLIFLRSYPILMPIVKFFQNPIIFSGTLFVYIGILRFFDEQVNYKRLITLFCLFTTTHIFFYLVIDIIIVRTLLMNISLIIIAFKSAYIIYKLKTTNFSSSANFNSIVISIHGLIFVFLTFLVLLGYQTSDMFAPNFYYSLLFADALIIGLLWTFGFILMLNQKLNAEIFEVKTQFEHIFNSSPDAAVISRYSNGEVIESNENYSRISGYSKEDLKKVRTIDLTYWHDPSDKERIASALKEKGWIENYEMQFIRKNGTLITGLVSAKIITLKGIKHILSVIRDISEIKQSEYLIKQKNEELEKLNAEKDKFFSIISHDLRSPFQSFLGLTQMMEDELHELSKNELQSITSLLKSSATNLFSLLENLLNWSKVRQGMIQFVPEHLKLNKLVNESLTTVLESANMKKISINIDISEKTLIYGDTYMLQTVIRNLVSNAVKFTPKHGQIQITQFENKEYGNEIRIKDTGIGINPTMANNLFNPGIQTNRQGTEGEYSSGLGLLLCKEFIEKHNGTIGFESEEGSGSTFYFTIPVYKG